MDCLHEASNNRRHLENRNTVSNDQPNRSL